MEKKWLEDKFTPGQDVWAFKNILDACDSGDFERMHKFRYTGMYQGLSPLRWCNLNLAGTQYPFYRPEEYIFNTELEAQEAARTHMLEKVESVLFRLERKV